MIVMVMMVKTIAVGNMVTFNYVATIYQLGAAVVVVVGIYYRSRTTLSDALLIHFVKDCQKGCQEALSILTISN